MNADATSWHTGIIAFTNSEAARKWWMITRSSRSAIVGDLLDMSGLKRIEDDSKELKKDRILKDKSDLNPLVSGIKDNSIH